MSVHFMNVVFQHSLVTRLIVCFMSHSSQESLIIFLRLELNIYSRRRRSTPSVSEIRDLFILTMRVSLFVCNVGVSVHEIIGGRIST